ncbi:MarR family winged helix-turn-helix transcriptional regulator [Kineococcus sp. G2]|uniref:MarR family winged helix-turn-helix transcriptional regulator n=1 Tax=Kineococcus sp. G2 TaxID=3127484 RepID=UPI00301D5FE3
MPHHEPAPAHPPGDRRDLLLPALAEEVTRTVRTLHALKAQDARADDDAERAVHAVLLTVEHHGAQRVGALAERLGTDPSTVSRQTAELVRRGLLERHRDPDDGRACRLAVTGPGREVVAVTLQRRRERLARAVTGWDEHDLGTFVSLLTRFADGLERGRDDDTGTAPAPTAATTRPEQETA